MLISKHRAPWSRQQLLLAGAATGAAFLLLLWLYYNHWFTAPVVNYLKNLFGVK